MDAKREIELLRLLIVKGAGVMQANQQQALDLLNKYLPDDNTMANKELFYKLVENIGQSKTVKLTPMRARKLKLRLKDFSDVQLLDASRIMAQDGFLMGDNPSGKKYGTIDYFIRNSEMIDNLLATNSNQSSDFKVEELEF